MLIFIFGGSASGKSVYAQTRLCETALESAERTNAKTEYEQTRLCEAALESGADKTYLATMIDDGGEAKERIRAHRRLRAGQGFTTVECPVNIGQAAPRCGRFILLEALSDLLANEMFWGQEKPEGDGWGSSAETGAEISLSERLPGDVVEKICADVMQLEGVSEVLVVVSDDIFADGTVYDPLTEAYRRNLGLLHRRIAAAAEEVTEVICGIPVMRKRR